jgi:hypothetical protein
MRSRIACQETKPFGTVQTKEYYGSSANTAANSQRDAMPDWVLFTEWIYRAKLKRIRSLGRHCTHLRDVVVNKL